MKVRGVVCCLLLVGVIGGHLSAVAGTFAVPSPSEKGYQYIRELAIEVATRLHRSEVGPGEYYLTDVCPDRPVVVLADADRRIRHIGFRLFSDFVLSQHPSPVYRFVERYLLELLLQKNNSEVQAKLQRERVSLTSECYSLTDYRSAIRRIVADFSDDLSLYVSTRDHYYQLSCRKGGQLLLAVRFPVRYELLTGCSKLEAEQSVYPSFLNYLSHPQAPAVSRPLVLSSYKQGLFSANEDSYGMPEIQSSAYYQASAQDTALVFSQEYELESACNLFNAGIDGVEMQVRQKLYGDKTNTFVSSIKVFMDFLRSQGCTVYTTVQEVGKEQIKGAVLAVNPEYGYQHLLLFRFDRRLFAAPRKERVTADMYCYIPIHNVKSLFDEHPSKTN